MTAFLSSCPKADEADGSIWVGMSVLETIGTAAALNRQTCEVPLGVPLLLHEQQGPYFQNVIV